LYLPPALPEAQRQAVTKFAIHVLALEPTPLLAVLTVPVQLEFSPTGGSARAGSDTELVVNLLHGPDGKSPITVLHPWIFGPFPITSSQKGISVTLRARGPGLSFDYHGTNANDAVFEESSPHR
jgi:hypothetical protein